MKKATPFSGFTQKPPKLCNEFLDDIFIQDYLQSYFPKDKIQEIFLDLENLGNRVINEFLVWANDAEKNEPYLIQFDAYGNRIDEIVVAQGWKNLHVAAAEEGLVAIGYERKFKEFSRLYQFIKLYYYTPSSAIYSCPLAMTDGAARVVEVYGNAFLKQEILPHLISRNPETFKTSGQWMTERIGGSDVSHSMTFAEKNGDDYLLSGHKWFTSAITADMSFTLASTEQATETSLAPLSLFYLPIRNEDGSLNGIEVEALKDKLGTRALPTAQLSLQGAKAKLVGEKGKGVRTISTLFNITRIYNTISAVSYMRRAYALCKAYSKERKTFGKLLGEHVLYKKNLRELEMAYQSNTILGLFLTRLLGKEECEVATENEKALLRLLTPIAKLYTAKQAIKSASEHVEMFGGLGYLEDTGIPVMLRNVQVLSIWEGATNVLSLDMLRSIEKENGLVAFKEFSEKMINENYPTELVDAKENIKTKIDGLFSFINDIKNKETMVAVSRDVAFFIAEATIALLWLDFLKTNIKKENYLNTLTYWLHYKMNIEKLKSSYLLGLA
ncbi:MAG: acyl-CoA dehydrogenase family protein [Bacteroidetes bacterium]|nr:acyl-CoA dehydrogenase family protein [Bacteroidota bacterium]